MNAPSPERADPGDEPPSSPTAPATSPREAPDGDVEVVGTDEQTDHPMDVDAWTRLARAALVTEGVRGPAELALLFVDREAMRDLNERFMGSPGPTDVLAFPLDEVGPGGRPGVPGVGTTGPEGGGPNDVPVLLGDVVVCPSVAHGQARDHGRSFDDEVALLVVHGVLHVLGHDHAEADEARRMRDSERALLDLHHPPQVR